MLARSLKAILRGEVQDTPFAGALASRLRGRPMWMRRRGAALEVRLGLRDGESAADIGDRLQNMVRAAPKASGTRVSVEAVDNLEAEVAQTGVALLPASLGSAETTDIEAW